MQVANELSAAPTELNINKLEKRGSHAIYFDDIYNFLSKNPIEWGFLNGLHDDFDSSYSKYGYPCNHNIEDFLTGDYSWQQYRTGFRDNRTTSDFFLKKTESIQTKLANIPVYVLVNGHGDIVLSRPTDFLSSTNPINHIREKLYDFSGGIDPNVEKSSALGLFFMNSFDAENCLKEAGNADLDSSEFVGLSVHCIGLDCAYRITREYHPGIDFRFVPNSNELKNLPVDPVETPNISFFTAEMSTAKDAENQQQHFLLQPMCYKKGLPLTFIGRFRDSEVTAKGVPVYVVTEFTNTNGCLKKGDSKNCIFFEKEAAIEFGEYLDSVRKTADTLGLTEGIDDESFVTGPVKSGIFCSNLEDLIEAWEDELIEVSEVDLSENLSNNHLTEKLEMESIPKTILNCDTSYFIPPANETKEVYKLVSPLTSLVQSSVLKVKFLKQAVGVIFMV